jgi:antitoxin (DNA-binding transcriptional repressor) of toxin-antitoxin stability system
MVDFGPGSIQTKFMKTVNIHEAKTHLSRILSDVERGEEYILARAGKAVARLSPIRRPTVEPRPGKWRGRVVLRSDFDAEDERINAMFEGPGQ